MAIPKKILLINPNISESDKNVVGYRVFPLGLGILASLLEERFVDVSVLDIRIDSLDKEAVINRLLKLLPEHDVIGISAIVNCLEYIEWLTSEIKKIKPSVTIILGGAICTSILPILARVTACDIFCIGEGERTIIDLLSYFEGKVQLDQIKGIAFTDEHGELINNPSRERLLDLDSIPLPAYHLFNTNKYAATPSRIPGVGRNMTIIAGRGCPFNCTYCLPAFGRKVIMRSPEKIIQEIELLHSEYGVVHIDFMDDLLCFYEPWVREFSQTLIDSGLPITWRGLGRANAFSKFKDSTVSLMKESGCHWIGFGFESASPKMLKTMKKKNTIEQMQKSVDICRSHKINITGTFIMGMPGESPETLEETFQFIRDNYLWPHFSYACPYPGTPLYSYALEKGLIDDELAYIKSIQALTDIYVIVCDMSEKELRGYHNQIIDKLLPRLQTMGIHHPTDLIEFEASVTEASAPMLTRKI